MNEKAFIQFEHVNKEYGTPERVFYALKDASFTIDEGEMVVILGPSGAGKSTLLNLLGGMDTATGGEIISCGEHIRGYNDSQLTYYRARNVAVVFQFYNLIPTLTAYENVALMKDIVKDTLDPAEALKAVGLEEHMHQFPAQMSGGEQQMLAIGRALMSNPRLLLLDEPSLGLAPIIIQQIFDTIEQLREQGMTIFLVEQNANQALKLADRGYVLENGHVVLSDTGDALLENEAVRSAYLGG